jgi:hypothetical protein
MECNKASKLHKLAADFVQISTESEAFLIDGLKDFFQVSASSHFTNNSQNAKHFHYQQRHHT